MPKPKQAVRIGARKIITPRISKETDEAIKQIAIGRGISVNCLINQVLDGFVSINQKPDDMPSTHVPTDQEITNAVNSR